MSTQHARKPITRRLLSNEETLYQAEKAISYCSRLKKTFNEWAIPKDFIPGDADYFAIYKLFRKDRLRKKMARREIWYRELFRRLGIKIVDGRIIFGIPYQDIGGEEL